MGDLAWRWRDAAARGDIETRTATVTLGRGARAVIGVGRVKTPTLAIACRRELEIRDFVPVSRISRVTPPLGS